MQIGKFRDVKPGVKEYFKSAGVKDKIVVDIPAGKGRMTEFLSQLGAKCKSLDLFTYGNTVGDIKIEKGDLIKELPLDDNSADYILCQEGIEHLYNQLKCLREFKRVLKEDGKLIITTPNRSNLRARFFMFFTGSNSLRHLPPNEVDDVERGENDDLCCGHLFLIGAQELRMLGILAGLKIKNIYPTRLSGTSLILFIPFYPLIALMNRISYNRSISRGNKRSSEKAVERKKVLTEILRINLSPSIMLSNHLFVEFEK